MDFNRRTIIGFGSISYFRSAKILSVCEVTSGQHLSVQLKYPIKGVEFKSEIPVIQTRPNSSINFVSPIKVWYNGQPFHSLPTALLYADKLKIKQQLGPKYDILTSNWPMPPNRTSGKFWPLSTLLQRWLYFLEIDASTDINLQSMAITLALIMGIMIMCATFTVSPVIERTNGVTALQHCSGSPVWIDWLARYVWDFFNIFPAFLTITIILFASRSVGGLSSLTDNYELFTVLFIERVSIWLPVTKAHFHLPLPVWLPLSKTHWKCFW